MELTSGGGGSSEKRKEVIKTRNRGLEEERQRVSNAVILLINQFLHFTYAGFLRNKPRQESPNKPRRSSRARVKDIQRHLVPKLVTHQNPRRGQ